MVGVYAVVGVADVRNLYKSSSGKIEGKDVLERPRYK